MNENLATQVSRILSKHRLKINDRTLKRFLTALESINDVLTPELIEILVLDNLTIGESYFFRDRKVYNFLRKILPSKSDWTVLSIGCSRGEEVYSFSMVAKEVGANFEITGLDVSPQRIEEAKVGCYKFWSVRFLDENELESFFNKVGDKFCVKSDYRTNVTFTAGNFLSTSFDKKFDIIFARRVLLYVENEGLAIKKMYDLLQDEGLLVLGLGEYFPQVLEIFEPIAECPCVYRKIQRKEIATTAYKNVSEIRKTADFTAKPRAENANVKDESKKLKAQKEVITKTLERELNLEPALRVVEHCLENKKLIEAENFLRKLVHNFPTHYLVWKYLGILEMEKGNVRIAKEYLKKAAFLNHLDDEIWQLLRLTKGNG
ncbi:CheR family methyltransferase [Fervidobacterium thailandense]|uniref:CheR family methyltransferase n=1 Tax=Fervidobacterium thailandense TaxID=1008305 RepID=UPI001F4F0901|nr:CheR family methyltransferase [Fervidobacterium thailandense]